MKIYIEDNTTSEIVIDGTPCRKLGDLLNGETKSFVVDSTPARVFVIADKMSKNFCNDFYQLDAGDDEISLSGQNKYNPVTGNPFRFDNNDGDEAAKNRRKNKTRAITICVISVIVGFAIGLTAVLIAKSAKETFTVNGMSITLPAEFHITYDENLTAIFFSDEAAVWVLQEEFALFEGSESYPLPEYAKLVQQSVETTSEIKTKDGLTYFEYDSKDIYSDDDFHHYVFVYKTGDSFWIFDFFATDITVRNYEKEIFKWAQTIEFE